jgi:hypothetical protein
MQHSHDPIDDQMAQRKYNHSAIPLEFEFDIVIVDGERGQRLAIVQANSILEVLEWFSRPSRPATQ